MSGTENTSTAGSRRDPTGSGRATTRRRAAAGPDDANERWSAADAREWLRPPSAIDHKVRRGVLGARIGSARYPGAAVLGVSAAWRTGIGMVRYVPPIGDSAPEFGLPAPAAAVLAVRPETLFGDGTCAAWLLGSGTDAGERSELERAAIARLHLGVASLVIDAGALESALTRTEVSAHAVLSRAEPSAPAVLTPHLGEFRRLWAAAGFGPLAADPDSGGTPLDTSASAGPLAAAVARLAAHLSATILLKGSTSLIASPGGRMLRVGPATPWLATAGTGDVLAGILGALVASHAEEVRADPELLAPLAATAALVHDTAARLASGDNAQDPAACTGSPITALDVVNAVPAAILRLSVDRAHRAPLPAPPRYGTQPAHKGG